MKRALALLIAVLLAPLAQADMVARAGRNELRLMDAPCRHGFILEQLKPEWRAQFRAGHADVNGKVYAACWILAAPGAHFVIFDDGDTQVFPASLFNNSGA